MRFLEITNIGILGFMKKGRCGTDPYNMFLQTRDVEDAVPYTRTGVLGKDTVLFLQKIS